MSNIRPSGSTKLKMPFADRSFDIVGSTEDISVFGAIKKGGGYWEPQIMNLMVRLVRPTDVCLDIGANLGAHTLALGEMTRGGGRVFAFEPSTLNVTYLRENIERNQMGHVSIQDIALGASSGRHAFINLVGMEGCSFLGPNDPTEDVILRSWGIRIDHVTEDVAVRTLDSWVDANSISRVDFVKMDVEGSEIGVIEGGMKTFHKHRPKLIVELNKNTLSLYYNLKPSIFFMMLTRIYDYIYIIPDDPEIPCVHVDGFEQIEIVLERPGHWWVDLLCLSHPL